MSLEARRIWQRVKVSSNVVTTRADVPIVINESLDGVTRVCEFAIAGHPALAVPAMGNTVTVEWCDFDADEYWPMFRGTINAIEVESQPWSFLIRAVGPLGNLRFVRQGSDANLTGKTDGEAWKFVMDYVGVVYDDADVADAGYVLGSEVDVKWPVDSAATDIIGELDRVFRMATLEIGDGRVIRIPYDPAPSDDTDLAATFERGVTAEFKSHRRTRGDLEAVQDVWIVQGVAIDVSDNCTATPWAKASTATPRRRIRRKVQTQVFQSDLIQDEALANHLVRALMKETNRVPDEAAVECVNHPNVYPGSKIKIVDPTYGISAAPRRFLVTSVDRSDKSMALTLVAGPAGDVGTVTTGADKVCNDTHTDTDLPGSFGGFPTPTYPPIIPPSDIDFTFPEFQFDTFNGFDDPEVPDPDEADDLLAPAWVPFWVNDNDIWGPTIAGSWTFDGSTGEAAVDTCDGAHAAWGTAASLRTGVSVGEDEWTLRAEGSTTLAAPMFMLQATDNDGGAGYVQAASLKFAAGVDQITEAFTEQGSDNPAGIELAPVTTFALVIEKSFDDFTFRIEQPSGSEIYAQTIASDWAANESDGDLEVLIVAYSDGISNGDCDAGALTLTALSLEVGVASPLWAEEFGSFTIEGSDLTETSGFGHAYYTGPGTGPGGTINTWNTITVTLDADVSATDGNEYFAVLLYDEDDTTAGYEIFGPEFDGDGDWLSDLYDFESGDYQDHETSSNILTPFHLEVTFSNALGSIDSVWNSSHSLHSSALGAYNAPVRVVLSCESGGTIAITNAEVEIT